MDGYVSKQPSLRDIAAATDVSVSTVSLVLNNRPGISEKTRTRVLKAAAKLGYGIKPASKNGRAATVGLLIEHGRTPVMLDIFYGDVIRGFQAEAQRLGYQVMLHMYDSATQGLDSIRSSLTGSVQGLVIANDGDITPQMVVQLEEVGVPLVLIENHIEGHPLPSVLGDNFTAGFRVMTHLLELGHRDIAILPGPSKYSSLVDRLRGCLAAAGEANVKIDAQFMPAARSDYPQKGYLQMKEILALSQLPTAVVAISDKTAFGAMSAIAEAGLRIPHDISIISIDDVADSAYTRPPLTTFHIPRREIGVVAMRKLHHLVNGDQESPVKSVTYGDLVVRESCRAVA
jgi:DNA-binding LacI/PurR family transcriptional regulator